MYDAAGNDRVRTEVEDLLDVVAVGDQLWAAAPRRLVRLSARDGVVVSSEPLEAISILRAFIAGSRLSRLVSKSPSMLHA